MTDDYWQYPVNRDALREKAAAFRKLHEAPQAFILPNAWDIGSAVILAEAGFPAIASTSAGVAVAQGYPDGQQIGRDEMLAVVNRMVNKVAVPVSADLEAGYGMKPEDVADTVRRAIDAGAVGANFEDGTRGGDQPLLDLSLNVERIRAAREAADAEDIPFVVNARTDGYLVAGQDTAEAFEESVRRANAYRAAGADCLFVPGKLKLESIRRLAEAIDGPLNVLGALSGYEAPSLGELQAAGVKRVSIGGSLSLAVLAFVKRVAEQLRKDGAFGYAGEALSNAKMNELLRR
ncbi:MAG: isocitrate lyase/phosphoenolpyruvate mutase family protein [SAR324 cluster bacterium]|nr:isocitrate lyase/phosphoenolpyruvate mutase family protein [SAR324 cluster bacterium]